MTVNPPKGKRGDFAKLSITLPPAMYRRLVREAAKRKTDRMGDGTVSAVIREHIEHSWKGE